MCFGRIVHFAIERNKECLRVYQFHQVIRLCNALHPIFCIWALDALHTLMPLSWGHLGLWNFAVKCSFSSRMHGAYSGTYHCNDTFQHGMMSEHIIWCTNHRCESVCYNISMSQFDFLMSVRVGEASNPGPWTNDSSRLKCCVINPTALVGKTDVIAGTRANLIFLSETSATDIVQKQSSKEYRTCGYKSFWSEPVGKKTPTIDNRPSKRGENAGTAILTNLPSRISRLELPQIVKNMCRINLCVVSFANIEVLAISIYGFPLNYNHAKKYTDILLSHIYQLVTTAKMPYIIGGDFNTLPFELPIFEAFRNLGAVEMFQLVQAKFGIQLPHTCRGVTSHDTCILHPSLAQRLKHAFVCQNQDFDSHSPLCFELDIQSKILQPLKWSIPKTWKDFHLQEENLQQAYQHQSRGFDSVIENVVSPLTGEQVLQQWSSIVERSVDQTVRIQHLADPLRNPAVNLPKECYGRCQTRTPIAKTFPKGPRGDKFNGYNPPVETISLVNRLKTRQVRRLKSYLTARKSILIKGQNLNQQHPQWTQLTQEWRVISNAQGYGRAWFRWILAFEPIREIPLHLPSVDLVEMCFEITKCDCDASCRQEALQRQKRFAYAVHIDNTENFGTITYKYLKNQTIPKLEEVPYVISQKAKLCRSTKGRHILRIEFPVSFLCEQQATFGEAKILLLQQNQCDIWFQVLEGEVPTEGVLEQKRITTTAPELFRQFEEHWLPFWMRDNMDEQFDTLKWNEFLEELNQCDIPAINLNIVLNDLTLWKKAIKKLKRNKAEGVCGWRHEELQSLPDEAIRHLMLIFNKIWKFGLTENLLQARTILLSKVSSPTSIAHGRPITIMSVLYRLASKIIFEQVVTAWHRYLPPQISGGLPTRGVRDMVVMQACEIEEAIDVKQALCGAALDLSKAFNLVPRLPALKILQKLGIPKHILTFWQLNLSRMTRLPYAFDQLGDPIPATTGVPEGDAWSVLCMIGISTVYYYRLQTAYTTPFAYADNWAWITRSAKEQLRNWIKVLNLVATLRMRVDVKKSWVWGSTSKIREEMGDPAILFPNQDIVIEVKSHVKDLGEIQQYDRQRYSEPVLTRIKNACQRIERLQTLHLPVQTIAHRIQTSVWPFGLHGADLHFVSPRHIAKLRRSATNAMVGKRHFANTWLAMMVLSRYIVDPLLFVVMTAFRLLRRMMNFYPIMIKKMIQRMANFNGKVTFGPASSIKRYLVFLDWDINENGFFSGPGWNGNISCLQSTIQELEQAFHGAWNVFVHKQIQHRRGIGEMMLDTHLTRNVFSSLKDADQAILALNLLGGFQTEEVKAKWDKTHESKCPLCHQVDTQSHRFLECQHFRDLRIQHSEAVNLLQQNIDWTYHPILKVIPGIQQLQEILQRIPPPERIPIVANVNSHHRYYTDGACENPTLPMIRRSSWAVIQDLTDNQVTRDQLAAYITPENMVTSNLKCLQTGLTHGAQTVARAELIALTQACQHAIDTPSCQSAEFVVDAQYVINVTHLIQKESISWHRVKNGDLVERLWNLWGQKNFTITKIKSHQGLHMAKNNMEKWNIVGNHFADRAAGQALQRVPQELKNLVACIANRLQMQNKGLLLVYQYLCALNRARSHAIGMCQDLHHRDINAQSPDQAMGDRAKHLMIDYHLTHFVNYTEGDISLDQVNANIQGARLAHCVWEWSKTLQWPDENQDNPPMAKWGVTWFELMINFIIVSGEFPPLKCEGHGSSAIFLPYKSSEGFMQPSSRRMASHLCLTFQNLVQCVQSITGKKIIPYNPRKKSASMGRLGFEGKNLTSFPYRPVMKCACETMTFVAGYITKLSGAKILKGPLDDLETNNQLQLDHLDYELDAGTRYRNYLQIRKRRLAN